MQNMFKAIIPSLLVSLLLAACANTATKTAKSNQPQVPKETVYYIPETASGMSTSSLAAVRSSEACRAGALWSVDGTPVYEKVPALVYLAPGTHAFSYNAYFEVNTANTHMRALGISTNTFSVEAGKAYSWPQILRQIDPKVFSEATSPASQPLMEYRSTTTFK